MGLTDGKEPLIVYQILGWGKWELLNARRRDGLANSLWTGTVFQCTLHFDPGLSVALVASTILIGLYGAGWQFNQLYGSVGDL